ncbi:MAG: molybdopterin oxidoreductase [Deltaproteobacteria bacterium]|nr:molybdopterin oxidoreductase [Deltaproteobacteria bacterium]
MEHKHYRSVKEIPAPPRFQMSFKAHLVWLGLVAVGAITFLVSLKMDADRAWHNYLLNYFYWMCLGVSGVFFVALQYITTSVWSTPLRRVPASFLGFLPVALVLLLILFAGTHHLYEWTHHAVVMADPILKGKTPYLNMPFFVIRNILFLALWFGAGLLLLKKDGEASALSKNRKISAIFILVFAVSFTMASFDLFMSLEPHWFSTIFGVYTFAGMFYSSMAMIIIFVIVLRRQGVLAHVVNENHLHDLGKLMFAFCVFWAYIAFSQYMLIWYGNLPEETGFMIRRTEGAWMPVALALLFGKFVIPFFLLISRPAKRHENYLLFVSVWVLAMQWLDCYWIVYPMLNAKPVFGWQEIGLFLGFMGLFVLSVTWVMQKIPMVPMKDPRLLEGVNHHQ